MNCKSFLDKEPFYIRRLVSEMIYIKQQENGINLQSDIEFFADSYLPITNMLLTSSNSNVR